MYCSIREFNEYNFSGDLSSVGEVVYKYEETDSLQKLGMTKGRTQIFVFAHNGVPNKDILDEMNLLLEARDNIKIMFYNMNAQLLPADSRPKGKYFYSFDSLNVDNFDMLNPILATGVSDIYISGQIGFEMEKLRKMCDSAKVSIRVLPNIATTSGITDQLELDDLTSFWIRPEDLTMYETYIDVIEFGCANDKQRVFYDIYFQDKEWHGNLSEIITGNVDIKNEGLTNHFGEYRANCGKKCIFSLCHKCHKLAALAEVVVDNNLKIEESI